MKDKSPFNKLQPSDPLQMECCPDEVPDVYASICRGHCLEPKFHDGDCLGFSKLETPESGDFVGVWFRREFVPRGEHPRQVKRLVSAGWPEITFPYEIQPGDELEPLVMLEMLNPPKLLAVPASHVLALHKVVGVAHSNGDGTAYLQKPVNR